jgi:hypothetical protein
MAALESRIEKLEAAANAPESAQARRVIAWFEANRAPEMLQRIEAAIEQHGSPAFVHKLSPEDLESAWLAICVAEEELAHAVD